MEITLHSLGFRFALCPCLNRLRRDSICNRLFKKQSVLNRLVTPAHFLQLSKQGETQPIERKKQIRLFLQLNMAIMRNPTPQAQYNLHILAQADSIKSTTAQT